MRGRLQICAKNCRSRAWKSAASKTKLRGALLRSMGMAQVLIIGASKGIGLETTRQALEAGAHVPLRGRQLISGSWTPSCGNFGAMH